MEMTDAHYQMNNRDAPANEKWGRKDKVVIRRHPRQQYNCEDLTGGELRTGKIVRIEDEAVFIDVGTKRDAIAPRNDLKELDDDVLGNLNEGDHVPVFIDNVPTGEEELFVSIAKGIKGKEWKSAADYLDNGEIIELLVTNHNQGGLIVAFGSLKGFVPNSHISRSRTKQNAKQIEAIKEDKVGSRVALKVIEVDPIHNRLILSEKITMRDRRQRIVNQLEVGQIACGKVVKIKEYGAFVDIGDIDGLLHVSELDWCRVKHPEELLSLGDEVVVQIKDVDIHRDQVSLSRKALLPNPWDEVGSQYDVGDLVEGIITGVTDFGAFVKLPLGVEGLIHVSEMNIDRSLLPRDLHKPGDEVLVRVVNIDLDHKRIGLSIRRVTAEEQLAWEVYSKQNPTGESSH